MYRLDGDVRQLYDQSPLLSYGRIYSIYVFSQMTTVVQKYTSHKLFLRAMSCISINVYHRSAWLLYIIPTELSR